MKFLHAADIHIDSRLQGLEAYPGAPVDRIRSATRVAFARLIDLAIDEQVDFVILAGDLFDGSWRDMHTGLWTANEFRRLATAGIPVYLLRGNHDAASEVRRAVTWPENVFEFSCEAPQTVRLDALQVALHGQGFAEREEQRDLAAGYPDAVAEYFNIGVLHTSLQGDRMHDTYAATSPDTLVLRGYDYWALGHIHKRQTIREEPRIEYPGNTQGRHIQEPGAKGCLLVEVDERRATCVEFRALDCVRWQTLCVDLTDAEDREEGLARVREALAARHAADAGCLSAVRVKLEGASPLHQDLLSPQLREEFQAEIRNVANEIGDVWVEKVLVETSPEIDLARLRSGDDLLGELLRSFSELRKAEDLVEQLGEHFEELARKVGLELQQSGIDLTDREQLGNWLDEAERIVAARLTQ